jgi:hypothetical protein
MRNDTDRARDALHSIPADLPRDGWVKAGMAAHAAGLGFDDFDNWSAPAGNYNAQACRATWRSFKTAPGGVGAGALFGMARDHGWTEGNATPRPAPERIRKPVEPPRKPAPGMAAADVWARCEAATPQHPYIQAKRAAGVPLDTLRVVPAGDSLTIQGERMAGALVVPVMRPDGTLSSLQFIAPPDVAERLKAKGKPGKLNLPGCPVQGWFNVGEMVPGGMAYVVEGVGQAWACWQSTGAAAVVCFGAGNMRKVAGELRQRDPSARLVLVPDVGKEAQATEIAAAVSGMVAALPPGWAQNSDVADLALRDGLAVLALLLEAATEPPVSYPVSVAFADELPERYEPPDELIEGVLTSGDGSVLYGDSNSGKTFLVIDLAASVARGVPWMDKRTEPGLVVYLAAESPASVRGRLQAYQKHHGCKVPHFAIVQSPIDLFDDDADTNRVITLVHQLERQRGQKVRLIVGDTLARLSAGANENAGQDMGLVVRRFDRIRNECKAHFLLIHHSGKNAANGARGWSGVRAAVDTEIEISDSASGRCVEITKQRDLPGKGTRIGFRLDVVTLGHTKWGGPATSCVVTAADAPVKAGKAIKLGETQQAVMALLRGAGKNMRIKEIAEQLAEQGLSKTSVYNAVNRLRDVVLVEVSGGMVHLIGGKP